MASEWSQLWGFLSCYSKAIVNKKINAANLLGWISLKQCLFVHLHKSFSSGTHEQGKYLRGKRAFATKNSISPNTEERVEKGNNVEKHESALLINISRGWRDRLKATGNEMFTCSITVFSHVPPPCFVWSEVMPEEYHFGQKNSFAKDYKRIPIISHT